MVQYMDNQSGFNQWRQMNAAKKPSKFSGFMWWLLLFLFAWWIMGVWFKPQTTEIKEVAPISIEQSKATKRNLINEDVSFDVQGLRISNVSLNKHKKDSKSEEHVSLLDKETCSSDLESFLCLFNDTFDIRNPCTSNVSLNKHKKDSKSEEHVSLLDKENNFVEIGYVSSDIVVPNINTHWEMKSGEMHWDNPSVHFARKISVNGYVINVTDIIKNKTNHEINIAPYVQITQNADINSSSAAVETGGVVYANSNLDYVNWNKLNKKSFAYSSVNASFGFAEQYWETIAAMDAKDQTISLKKSGDLYFAQTNVAPVKVAAKGTSEINTYVFAGPRQSDVLNAASQNIPGISKTMDYGWFWFFAQPMLWMINWLYVLVGNYGIAIILMTLILRLLIWPLTRKSYVSTMAMQRMQPELQRVQKLYANDKARLQIEMMKVYQTHKTSPMSGCLPMLIQIPIFFALYKALLISVPMRSAHFLWVSDLAVMDPYFILPILMGATMWLQQYLQSPKQTSNTNDITASTQRAMKWMPLLFTVMFAWMPAGLVLYWTVSNLFGILQMYIIKKTTK